MFYILFVYFYYFLCIFSFFYNKQNNLNSGSIQLYTFIYFLFDLI